MHREIPTIDECGGPKHVQNVMEKFEKLKNQSSCKPNARPKAGT
jgi:hypothetical protein